MRVMGIDPSTAGTGISIVASGKKVLFTEEIAVKKLTGIPRVSAILTRLAAIHSEQAPDLVVIEEMIIGHASSAIPIVQLGSIIRYYLWQEGIRYVEVHPSILKKFVAGSGSAKKEQIMMYVSKNWGFEAQTNNIADAVGLAMVGLHLIGEPFSATQKTLCLPIAEKFSAINCTKR